MIEITNLTKQYGQRFALHDITLNINPGRVVGLFGENGCGKTTLLKTLAGFVHPSGGIVKINGELLGAATKAQLSYLPDYPNFRQSQQVESLLVYYSDFFADFDEALCRQMLQRFEIDPSVKVSALSKGQREKVQVALAMSRAAKVYLLDEPISGVDPLARETILRTIISAIGPDATLLIATHLINEIEPLLDDVILMRHGAVLVYDSAEAIRARTGKSLNEYFKEVYA